MVSLRLEKKLFLVSFRKATRFYVTKFQKKTFPCLCGGPNDLAQGFHAQIGITYVSIECLYQEGDHLYCNVELSLLKRA